MTTDTGRVTFHREQARLMADRTATKPEQAVSGHQEPNPELLEPTATQNTQGENGGGL